MIYLLLGSDTYMKIKKIISIILVILWMGLIFKMSSYNGIDSGNQSGFIVNFIANIFNINNLDIISFIVRKIAHLSEYLILGILAHNLIKNYNKKTFIAILICIIYAISDEIHQIFVPGREFKLLDICIDSIGSIIGIYMYKYILYITNKYKKIN